MKNIVLLTHGDFSKGIAQSSRFIVGAVENIVALSITLNETIEQTIEMIEKSLKAFNNQLPTIIVTDLPGGSTTQAAIKFLSEHENVYLITGLNLGLLLELIMVDFAEDYVSNLEILRNIVEGARQTITLVNDICAENTDDLEGEL
jgi:mannose/fructose-specific phosphotransferase system component IIA